MVYVTYDEYPRRWGEIASVFSKDAILKGSFDKYAASARRKRGTAEVDVEFLKEIEGWRDELARNIALRNPTLNTRDLNYTVTKTIDRILFLRMCEDRGVETYAQLRTLPNGPNIYPRLVELFRRADERYNSGLFHFELEKDRAEAPDELTPTLTIDDRVLKDIIKRLYYPECPYEFSIMPSEILGQVYEQFLGKVITLTAGHRAKIEFKPEVRKAGGVYYTPKYIVDYIVAHTVGKLLEDKTPADVGPMLDQRTRAKRSRVRTKTADTLCILDPACGSGSFLLGAYQYLLDWHLTWYVNNDPDVWARKRNPTIYQSPKPDPTGNGATWRLTVAERKRILLNNIYGVDIDPQAVEVTKLSLLLKVLEGESQQSLDNQLRLFHERALPDLGHNIKCGNSLIGPDFYADRQLEMFDDEERYRINAFDWQAEFADILRGGGFHAVIGNPPYVRIQGFPTQQIAYFSQCYRSAVGNFDIYIPFIEQGHRLIRPGGMLGMITPNKFFRTDYGEGLRKVLSDEQAVARIVHFGANQVFTATTYTCLVFLRRGGTARVEFAETSAEPRALMKTRFRSLVPASLTGKPWTFEDEASAKIIKKLGSCSVRLLDLPADMSRGSSTGADRVFVIEKDSVPLEPEALRIPLFASCFGRYCFRPSHKWRVIFPYRAGPTGYVLPSEERLRHEFPKTHQYLSEHQAMLKNRKQYKEWFGYSAPRNLLLHDRAQIAVPLLADRGLFAMIPSEFGGRLCPMASGGFTICVGASVKVCPEYVLGLLNSTLLFWRLQKVSNIFRGGWITCTKQYFGQLPIRTLDLSDESDKASHDSMVSLVQRMLDLHKQLGAARTPTDKTGLQRQIDATDRRIDQLVYQLYGLTDDEIHIVEESTSR